MARPSQWTLPLPLFAVIGLALLFGTRSPDKDRRPIPAKTLSGAMQALDLWAAQRAYPNPAVPAIGHALAFEQTRAVQAAPTGGLQLDDGVAPWISLGPNNIGGRTLALAVRPDNPDVLFAGSASGGLWKSTTGGVGADAWDYVDTGFPVLGVSTIAIDPVSPDVMYIGTGEVYRYQDSIGGDVDRTTRGSYGIGILKSTDGGATWFKSLDWTYAQTRGVWCIRIHPTDSSVLYAATTEGVYKSTDAGVSWSLVHAVIMTTDLRIHPSNPDIVLVACGNFSSSGHGIYKSTNAGANWTKVTVGLPATWSGKAMIHIAPSSPNVVYASIADTFAGYGLYRSTNTGDSWTRVNATDFQQWQGWYSHWVLVSPTDPDRVLVGGIEIWRSTNGGSTLERRSDWTSIFLGTPPPGGPAGGTQYAHADHHFSVWHPTEDNTIFFASDGGVFQTTDFCETFRGLNGSYVTTQFYQGFASSASNPNLAIGGMQDNLTAIYEGSPAWRRVIGGDGSWAAINPLNNSTLYGSWQNLNIQRSYDGGINWTGVTPPEQLGDVTAFVAPFVLSPSGPSILYAGRSRVYRTSTEGTSWVATNGNTPLDGSNPVFTLAVSTTNSNLVYAATAPAGSRGRVFRTMDGGTSWTDITGNLPDRYPSDLAVDPTDDATVCVTFMGFGSSHVFRSTDGGDSWTDIGGDLPDVPTSSVEVDPDHPKILYVGTDLGAYVSPNTGANWFPFQQGMPITMVNDLKVFGPSRKIRAATHGNGVYERDLLDPALVAVGEPGPPPGIALRVAPNPLRAEGRISFTLQEPTGVRLSLFDVHGRRLAVVLEETRGAGEHIVPLDRGGLSGGVYFLRMEAGDRTAVTRVVFLR